MPNPLKLVMQFWIFKVCDTWMLVGGFHDEECHIPTHLIAKDAFHQKENRFHYLHDDRGEC